MKSGYVSRRTSFSLLVSTVLLGGVTGCETMQQIAFNRAPTAQVQGVRFAGLDASQLDLVLDLVVDNPNAIGVSLSGLDYSVAFEGQSLAQGINDSGLTIPAQEKGNVSLPVKLKFTDLAKIYQMLGSRQEMGYDFQSALKFNVPVLGEVSVPVNKQGTLPVVRPPKVSVSSFRRKSLDLTGAELELTLAVANPNAFAMSMNSLDYQLTMNGESWAQGQVDKPMGLESGKQGTVTLPVRVDFLQMGRGAFQALSGSQAMNYSLNGKLGLSASHAALKNLVVPMDLSGQL